MMVIFMLDAITQVVYVIGRIQEDGIVMLGTGFAIKNMNYIVTPRHVVGDNDNDLVMISPAITSLNEYQDTTINECSYVKLKIKASDPFRDLVILEFVNKKDYIFPTIPIGSSDDVNVGDEVYIFGFPHCVEGRRVLTMQKANVGAKILLNSSSIKSKYFVINTQTRPGQSGSIIYSAQQNKIIGVLIGAFAPDSGISIVGINPRELHQTTQCISAEYINKMIGE